MKLRFNLDVLVPDIARRLAEKHRLIELKPMMWVDPNYKEFYAQSRGPFKDYSKASINAIHGVRYVKTVKGHTIFFDNVLLEAKDLPWCEAHLKQKLEGYNYYLVLTKKMDLQLHVSDKGIVRFRTGNKGIRCLSLQNLIVLDSTLSRQDATKLFTLSCNQEWVADLMHKTGISHFPMANNVIRSCSSFQQFINKVNQTKHRVSAKRFDGLGFREIFEIMTLVTRLHNPHELLENPGEYISERKGGSDKYQLLSDYFNMMDRQGEKSWYTLNINRIREHHDKAVLRELETAPITPIRISPIAYLFNTYFPGAHYELIEDGNRLKKESLIQHHCVSSYDNRINKQECFIISVLYEDHRYTGEIRIYETSDGGIEIYLNQLKGFGNSEAPNELRMEINGLIKKFKADQYRWKDINDDFVSNRRRKNVHEMLLV